MGLREEWQRARKLVERGADDLATLKVVTTVETAAGRSVIETTLSPDGDAETLASITGSSLGVIHGEAIRASTELAGARARVVARIVRTLVAS